MKRKECGRRGGKATVKKHGARTRRERGAPMDFVTGTPNPEALDALIESLVNFLIAEKIKEAENKSDPPN